MLEAGTFPNLRHQATHVVSNPGAPVYAQRPYTATGNTPTVSNVATDSKSFRVPNIGTTHSSAIHIPATPTVQPVQHGFSQSRPNGTDVGHTDCSMPTSQEASARYDQPVQPVALQSIVPITSAVIDVYQPHPSTAPAPVSQHLGQMLPPRRDLPFKVSKPGLQQVSRSPSAAPTKAKAKKKAAPKVKVDPTVLLVPDSQESAGTSQEKPQPSKVVNEPTASQPPGKARKSCEECRRKKVSKILRSCQSTR
jgi:hypothetical protein